MTALETLTLLQHHGSPNTPYRRHLRLEGCSLLRLRKRRRQGWSFVPHQHGSGQVEQIFRKTKMLTNEESLPFGRTITHTFLTLNNGATNGWPAPGPSCLPHSLDPRMIAQRGLFLVGGVPSLQGWTMLETSECPHCQKRVCECSDFNVHPRAQNKSTRNNQHRQSQNYLLRSYAILLRCQFDLEQT